jgi:NAD(P)-dependent dehydrogenase (short-subunit alcohol dehydrogenase family)
VRIVITGRDQAALDVAKEEIEKEAPHCTVSGVAANVGTEAAARDVFAALPDDVRADVLVNNAGVCSSPTLLADSDPDSWWNDWQVNVRGTYLMTRAFLRRLKGGPGAIINVTTSVSNTAVPNMSAYGPSKLAVNRLTQIVQAEYGAQGVQCVCFHPGGVATTDMGRSAPAQYRGMLHSTEALGGGTALYLSTPRAAFLGGRMVYAEWDMERVEAHKEHIVGGDLFVSKMGFGEAFSDEIVTPS